MPDKPLLGMKVAILCTDLFEQVEMTEPRKALEDAGADTVLVAPHDGEVQGVHHDKKGDTFKVDMTLDEADPASFDALMLPGGAMNADALRMNEKAQKFARVIDEASKPIAVICHGPWLLISASLVRGKTMTSYHTIQDDVRNAGASWVDQEVMRQRNWVSSRQPGDIPAFNREMVSLFAEHAPAGRKVA
jgi:protease I